MSITICWRPTATTKSRFSGGTSGEFKTLEETFGNILGDHDVKTLRAMRRASGSPFYDEVADRIESVGKIEIWGEY